MKRTFLALGLSLGLLMLFLQGCKAESYPVSKLREAVFKICEEEYGIDDVDVKIAGDTIGVYLPLQKLFAADFKETAITGKVRNLETLFEPSPEALEKIEDVLFTISRVILSTDKAFKFYVLQATDAEKTGMQFILTGCVDDIKRVRVWDISRNEYRKRVIHELKLNHAVIWHKPVRQFFEDISRSPIGKIQSSYFGPSVSVETLQNLFFNSLWTGSGKPPASKWTILDMRSAAVQKNQALVYAKVRAPIGTDAVPTDLQYIFLVSQAEEHGRIVRIIPFQYKDEKGELHRIAFPKDLQIQSNLDRWETEFTLEDISVGKFLAAQVTRRVQGLMASDERIQNTFRDIKLNFDYREEAKPYFSLDIETTLKDFNHYSKDSLVYHEDMLYLLNLVSREFVEVLRGYQFEKFDYLKLNLAQDAHSWSFAKQDLELFRRKKIDFPGLLGAPKI